MRSVLLLIAIAILDLAKSDTSEGMVVLAFLFFLFLAMDIIELYRK